ncbi:MAG: 2-succinyl-5-enolpyruvyl-6-hydroxy-3-cyclohexene-1-carboxylic-acid synthase [Halodesulfurarchaeum sp.]
MTAPNVSTLWAEVIIEELQAAGLDRVVIAPGSRSTPLTVAADRHADLTTDTHLDERSAGFYALGYGKRRGEPAALISTSGTAAVNFHPAVVEAHQSRTPLVVLTADRPPELQDSGANQTIDQTDLYGTATRFDRTLPTPDAQDRTLRSLRTTVGRAVAATEPPNPGPVHLNVPFRKPLAPIEEPDQHLPDAGLGAEGRDGPYVTAHGGSMSPSESATEAVETAIEGADRGLLVAGPLAPDSAREAAIAELARRTGFPLLADPLSNVRYGDHPDAVTVCGGYDGYLGTRGTADWPDPDVILRFGASPTSKPLRRYLEAADARQFVVDPAGGWREATFTASDLVQASVPALVGALGAVEAAPTPTWVERFQRAESVHWAAVEAARATREGAVLAQVVANAPDPATVFVSNSMPVRDLDRYGRPRTADLAVLGNRGASGIDGILSTALGAGQASTEPLVAVTGDLAYFHDMNGLFALGRFGPEATIVLVNNDGGGIFHMLPISDVDPPFERQFETPHGLDFEPTEALYELEFEQVEPESIGAAVADSAGSPGTQVLEVRTDAEASHRDRDALRERVGDRLAE